MNCSNCGAPPSIVNTFCEFCRTPYRSLPLLVLTSRKAPARAVANHPYRSLAVVLLVFQLSFAGMCSATRLALLKSALNSAPALVDSLVASGVITQPQANGVIKDFTDGADLAVTLGRCLNDVPKDTPETKRQQYDCAHTGFTGWRQIANRGHFTINPKIQTAFTVADGIFEFVDAFYSDRAGNASHADVGADGLSDEEFEQALDARIKDLKSKMKP